MTAFHDSNVPKEVELPQAVRSRPDIFNALNLCYHEVGLVMEEKDGKLVRKLNVQISNREREGCMVKCLDS